MADDWAAVLGTLTSDSSGGTTPALSASGMGGELDFDLVVERVALSTKESAKREQRLSTNAAACKRLREKRKHERDSLRCKIQAIEAENGLLQKRVAQLQTEVQTCRVDGEVNLAKENALLRAEIKKHKAFIERVVAATNGHELRTDEERYRLLRSGVDSTMAQLSGLAYTSATGVDWTKAPLFSAILEKQGMSVEAQKRVSMRFQTLPLGCTPTSVQRVNVRVQMLNIPLSRQTAVARIKRVLFTLPERVHDFEALESVHLKSLEERFEQDDGVFKVFRYEAANEALSPGVCACACVDTTIFRNVFLDAGSESESETATPTPTPTGAATATATAMETATATETATVPATQLALSTDALDPEVLAEDGAEPVAIGVAESLVKGFTVVDAGAESCHTVFTASFPLNGVSLAPFEGLLGHPGDILDADTGLLSDALHGRLCMMLSCLALVPQAPLEKWAQTFGERKRTVLDS